MQDYNPFLYEKPRFGKPEIVAISMSLAFLTAFCIVAWFEPVKPPVECWHVRTVDTAFAVCDS